MNENNLILLNFLENILGTSKHTSKTNYAFKCPNNCHITKKKLEIDINTNENKENKWHCWICGIKGKTIFSLLKTLKINDKNIYSKLNLIILPSTKTNYVKSNIKIPDEYLSFTNKNISQYDKIIRKHALNFLYKRNISNLHILKYDIGYCTEGKYKNRIIIPSYNSYGDLNYFIGRDFMGNDLKYLNPPIEKDRIIGFEFYINWNLPIILVEGIFDALTIQRNTIPLFGKTISDTLLEKIIESNSDKIYIALDNDALKNALDICDILLNLGKKVYLVDMKGKDFSEIGFKNSLKILENTHPLSFKKIIEYKLK